VVIEGDLSDVMFSCEEEGRVAFGGLAPGAVPGVLQVAPHALALEAPLLIHAQLRACPRNIALIDICKF